MSDPTQPSVQPTRGWICDCGAGFTDIEAYRDHQWDEDRRDTRATAKPAEQPPLNEWDDVFEFIEALMNADLSYATLPITDEHLTVRDVIEPETWDREIAALKAKAEAAAPDPVASPEAERLLRRFVSLTDGWDAAIQGSVWMDAIDEARRYLASATEGDGTP